jgi:TMEM175 potassium channel family protein
LAQKSGRALAAAVSGGTSRFASNTARSMGSQPDGPSAQVTSSAPIESGLQRIEAFSDSVMAVIITIMAFELKPPLGANLGALESRLPALLVYVLSFVFVGIYWNNHHHLLRSATRLSGTVMWTNLLLLFWLSLIPVLTAWLATDYMSSLPAAAYGVAAMAAGVAYFLLVRALVAANGRNSALAQAVSRDVKGVASIVIYAAGVVAALITPWISYGLFVAVSIMWIVPDRRLARPRNRL